MTPRPLIVIGKPHKTEKLITGFSFSISRRMSDIRSKIIEALDVLRRREVSAKSFFKARAYAKVIDELRISKQEIRALEDIDTVPGVGEKIRKKVKEILETGHLQAANKAKAEFQLDTVDVLTGVYGIGVVKAKELIALGIKSIPDLREALAANPKLLNDKQKIGLQYYEEILERIPRDEMKQHERLLLGALEDGMRGTVVGSYRRGLETSGDIDVLLTMPGLDEKKRSAAFASYVERLRSRGYMIEVLSQGDQKCLSIVKLTPTGTSRRLDLLVVPMEQFPYALLYFTGSGDFNVAFRKYALKQGYTLNEHEMKLTGKVDGAKPVPKIRYEAEIFAFLGLKYKEPVERAGAGAIEELSENTKRKVALTRKTAK
jgi:DNA polymerase beta